MASFRDLGEWTVVFVTEMASLEIFILWIMDRVATVTTFWIGYWDLTPKFKNDHSMQNPQV
jgi:hypothetical protein